ncbi:hypothetical protein ABZT51_43410, partial [Streptomyces sp. NPDC005373]
MADPEAPRSDLPECPSAQGGGLLPKELRAWMLMLAAMGSVEQELRTVVKEQLDVSHDEFLILCLLAEQPRAGLRPRRCMALRVTLRALAAAAQGRLARVRRPGRD